MPQRKGRISEELLGELLAGMDSPKAIRSGFRASAPQGVPERRGVARSFEDPPPWSPLSDTGRLSA